MERTSIRELAHDELDAVQGGYAGLLVVLIAAMGAATAWYVEPKTQADWKDAH
jgi:hypothetical protein